MNLALLNKKIVLTDGGLGTTLHEYGLEIFSDPLWLRILKEKILHIELIFSFFIRSGKVLVEHPEQVAKVHRA